MRATLALDHRNSAGSKWRFTRGEGVTDSQAVAWGEEMDKRRALSVNTVKKVTELSVFKLGR